MFADIVDSAPKSWGDIIKLAIVAIVYLGYNEWRTWRIKRTVKAGTAVTVEKAEVAATAAAEATEKMGQVYNVLNGNGILGILRTLSLQLKRVEAAAQDRLKDHSTRFDKISDRIDKIEVLISGAKQAANTAIAADDDTGDLPPVLPRLE